MYMYAWRIASEQKLIVLGSNHPVRQRHLRLCRRGQRPAYRCNLRARPNPDSRKRRRRRLVFWLCHRLLCFLLRHFRAILFLNIDLHLWKLQHSYFWNIHYVDFGVGVGFCLDYSRSLWSICLPGTRRWFRPWSGWSVGCALRDTICWITVQNLSMYERIVITTCTKDIGEEFGAVVYGRLPIEDYPCCGRARCLDF